MVRHVVVFRWAAGTTAGQVAAVEAALGALPEVIETLRAYRFGADLGLADGNGDFAVVADFDDVAGYERYRDDPEHQRVIAECIRPIVAERTAVQYAFD